MKIELFWKQTTCTLSNEWSGQQGSSIILMLLYYVPSATSLCVQVLLNTEWCSCLTLYITNIRHIFRKRGALRRVDATILCSFYFCPLIFLERLGACNILLWSTKIFLLAWLTFFLNSLPMVLSTMLDKSCSRWRMMLACMGNQEIAKLFSHPVGWVF